MIIVIVLMMPKSITLFFNIILKHIIELVYNYITKFKIHVKVHI